MLNIAYVYCVVIKLTVIEWLAVYSMLSVCAHGPLGIVMLMQVVHTQDQLKNIS